MTILESVMIIIMLILCIQASKTDIREGKVYNKTLLFFGGIGIVIDVIYYLFFNTSMMAPFMVNFVIIVVVSLVLFYTHSFAGGDCKLLMVLTILYPAKCYISYAGNLITIVFTVGFALFLGYIYLLFLSIYELIIKKNKISLTYVKGYLITFIKSFVIALIYISAVTLLISFLGIIKIEVPIFGGSIICILVSLIIGKFSIFKKRLVVISVIVLDVIASFILRIIPFSIHPENYILVIMLLLCQMMIKTSLYQEIPISSLKSGLILSMGSSLLMQNSRVRGLPKISSEDLRDRLSEDEIVSIQRWAKAKEIKSLSIVRKIPFATFIALGYVSYWMFWGILKWL